MRRNLPLILSFLTLVLVGYSVLEVRAARSQVVDVQATVDGTQAIANDTQSVVDDLSREVGSSPFQDLQSGIAGIARTLDAFEPADPSSDLAEIQDRLDSLETQLDNVARAVGASDSVLLRNTVLDEIADLSDKVGGVDDRVHELCLSVGAFGC